MPKTVDPQHYEALILVFEDVEETRDAIEQLLKADGYRVISARDEQDAVIKASGHQPDLILVGLGGPAAEVISRSRRVRELAQFSNTTPIVIFSLGTVEEGAEVNVGEDIHIINPDNFNQLRGLIARILTHNHGLRGF